jgi:hypothetical protein
MDENTASKPLKPLIRVKNPVSLLSLYISRLREFASPGNIEDFT